MSLFRSSLVLNKARWGLLLPLLLWFSGCSEVNVDAVPGAAAAVARSPS